MIIKLIKLFLEFFKIGLFTFGGGYAMIPIISEVVDYGWISQEQFQNMVGLAEVTPGPIALNMATYVGATQAGFLGGVFSTIGVVLPSFIIICIVAALLSKFSENKYIKAALRGTMYVAIGLIVTISITMTLQTLTNFEFNDSFRFDFAELKVFVFVLIGYILMWISRNKKPGPIPTIFMSLFVGLIVNLGYIPTIIGFLALESIYLLIPQKK